MFPLPSLITLAAIMVYFILSANVGRARLKYNVPPPKMAGNEDFERVVRVHENTLEQLIQFLPTLWLFALFVDQIWSAILGGIWIVGRIFYAWGYYQAAEKRTAGFGLSSLSFLALLIGALIGVTKQLISGAMI